MSSGNKSWQSRLSQDQDELAIQFVESLSVDTRLYKYDIAGSIAHAQMLSEQKLITKDDFKQIKQGLVEIAEKIEAGKFKFDITCEDIHMVIEAALIKKIGDVGKKLHTGRSRNDQVALDMRLWTRDAIQLMLELIANLQKALVKLAGSKNGQIVIPGYTHLQRAQPVLAGHYLMAYVEQFQRDKERFADSFARVNSCPLGSGAIAGCSLPLDRHRVAEILGFDSITRNSMDSISDRDFCVEFIFNASMTAMHMSRLAEDWIIYTSQEFSFIRSDDAYCTGSSMMPQKRNPDMLELIRGKTGSVFGNLMAFLTMLKGLPMAYNRDMQEDKKQLFDAADTLEASLRMTEAIVSHTKFNGERIGDGLENGFLDATAMAEYLVNKGVPFRQAHQIVGSLVAACEKQGKAALAELTIDELKSHCDTIDEDVYHFLTAKNVAANYCTAGAGGSLQLDEQVAFWKEQLK